jgi:hypothetical protein
MRADSHYVDALDTNTFAGRNERAVEKAPGGRDEPAIAELTRCLRTLELSQGLIGDAGSPLTRSVGVNLMRAESRRAACFLQAVRVMRDEVRSSPKRLSVEDVVARVLQAVEPERCLRSITLKPQLTLSHSSVHADEDLLIGALSSVLLVTFALVDGSNMPVSVSARVNPHGEFSFLAAQDAASVKMDAAESVGLLIRSADRAIETCGGTLTVTARGCGSEIHAKLPTI